MEQSQYGQQDESERLKGSSRRREPSIKSEKAEPREKEIGVSVEL